MRYQLEPRYRKYVQDYGFLSFLRKFRDKYRKKMDTAKKQTNRNRCCKNFF